MIIETFGDFKEHVYERLVEAREEKLNSENSLSEAYDQGFIDALEWVLNFANNT